MGGGLPFRTNPPCTQPRTGSGRAHRAVPSLFFVWFLRKWGCSEGPVRVRLSVPLCVRLSVRCPPLVGCSGQTSRLGTLPVSLCPPLTIAQGMLRNRCGSLLAPSPLRAAPPAPNPPKGVLRLP